MAAVKAKKQAEPLMISLVNEAELLREDWEVKLTRFDPDRDELEIPAAVARLIQCLSEKSEASPATLARALPLLVLFARGCHEMRGSWQAISRGPYGSELLHQAWLQYAPMRWHRNLSIATTLAHLMASRKPEAYWETDGGKSEIVCDLENSDEESITRSLMTLISLCWERQIVPTS